MNKNENVRNWYTATFPTDDLGMEINPTITFEDVYERMLTEDVYNIFGVGDSIIRERVFSAIADCYDVPYDTIYYRWLNS